MLEFPPNQTALYQIVLFLALWALLKRLVFDRFLENLKAREKRTSGALAEAKALRDEAARLRAEHEELLADVRREASAAREEIRRQGEKEERQILDGARDEATRVLDQVRSSVARESADARAKLESETRDLAERIAENLLRRAS